NPNEVGNLELGSDANEVVVIGNYAYIASDSDTQELQVVDVSNVNSPSLVASLNLANTANAETIDGNGDTVVIGRDTVGQVHVINISDPLSPTDEGSYTANGSVQDVVLGNGNMYAFIASSTTNNEFQALNISAPTNIVQVGS